jgi:hypothetical protein
LELLLEKARILRESSFMKFLRERGTRIEISFSAVDTFHSVTQFFPDREAIDAFILSLRFFLNDRDGFSFRKLVEEVSNDPALSENWKQTCKTVRVSLNQYLDAYAEYALVIEGIDPTRREVLDTFLYGDLAHTDPKHRPTFEQWRSDPVIYSHFYMVFIELLQGILGYIECISYCSEDELKIQHT